jgi:hypothetical protein
MERIKGRLTIRDILVQHDNWRRFVAVHGDGIRPVVYENVRRMLACRTPELGLHVYACPSCGEHRLVPHTCKSRLCSSCGKPATDRWAEEVLNNTLDVEYHHLVLSVPWQFRSLTLANRRLMLNILFRSAAKAIIPWCQTYHDFTPGLIAVMHTFGADLKFHPHVHVLVTAGGLSGDGQRWVRRRGGYLMPEAGLKKRWRYEVTSRVNEAHRQGELTMPRLAGDRRRRLKIGMIMGAVLKMIWYVTIGTSLKQIGFAVSYIGRYTRRPVIAEGRLLRADAKWVIFRYKDYSQDGRHSVKKLRVMDFIARLIRHIPDKHFRMVRHYGLFATRVRGTKLAQARQLLGRAEPAATAAPTWRERHEARTGVDPLVCPRCGTLMELDDYYFGSVARLCVRFGLKPKERIAYRTPYRDSG